MAEVAFAEFSTDPARFFDAAERDGGPVVITRAGRANMVLVTEREFEGWRETVHLLSSPRNAARLLRSVKELDAGLGEERCLIECPTEGGSG